MMDFEILEEKHEGLHITRFVFSTNGQPDKAFRVYSTDVKKSKISKLERIMDYWDLHCSPLVKGGLRP